MSKNEMQQRIDDLERRVFALEAWARETIPAASRPYDPRSPDERRAFLRQLAARARAAKPVGRGRGAVSPEAHRRLRQQAQRKRQRST